MGAETLLVAIERSEGLSAEQSEGIRAATIRQRGRERTAQRAAIEAEHDVKRRARYKRSVKGATEAAEEAAHHRNKSSLWGEKRGSHQTAIRAFAAM